MKKIKKFLDFQVQKSADQPNTYKFVSSTNARDRQGDIIVQSGWKTADFMKNPVVLWAHDYTKPPIGKAQSIEISNGSLSATIRFASDIDPFAKQVEAFVSGGYLNTVSVGFMVYKSEALTAEDLLQRPEMKYGSRLYGDLLEISVVPVPANPEALVQDGFGEMMVRSFAQEQPEAQSRFLPYLDAKGEVAPRMLRASVAAALGARGGVKITDADPRAALNHLYRVAKENGIELPNRTQVGFDGSSPERHIEKLKQEFPDVWHDELLEVIHRADGEPDETVFKLIKGEKRQELVRARDALNVLLDLTEETVHAPEPSETELMKQLTTDLSALAGRLK